MTSDSPIAVFRAGSMYLSARELEALDRLLWAYLGTEEGDPMQAELEHIKAKIEWRATGV